MVFKTLSEQHLGDLSLVRVYSGHLEAGKELANTTRNRSEKTGTLYHLVGKERIECKSAVAGDIVAAVKLRETHTGDTLADKARPVAARRRPTSPRPVTAECVRPKSKGDEEKMAQGLNRLHEEDPTFSRAYEISTKETLVTGMGDLQFDVMVDRLKKRFGVDVLLQRPRVPYRETIRGTAKGEYRHKKQTGGRGPVRRGAPAARAAQAQRGLRVPRRGQGRRGAEPVHPRGREGRRRRHGEGPDRRLPGRGRGGRALLRQAPRRGLIGNGVQDRGRDPASTR